MSYSNRVFIFLFSCSKSSLCIGYQYTSAEACRIISTKEGSNDTLLSEERNHLFSKGNFETKTNKTEFTLAMICVINFIRTNLLTVLLFQHFFQTQCLVLSSTYQRATPLSPYISFFSLYLAFIYISCVWINVVDINHIFVSLTSFTANPTDSSDSFLGEVNQWSFPEMGWKLSVINHWSTN